MGRVEWELHYTDPRTGEHKKHSEGAQTQFGLARARKILKVLGSGWEIRHRSDPTKPDEQQE